QDRLVARDRQPVDLLAIAAAVEDDVVHLAVEAQDVDRNLRSLQEHGQLPFDGLPRLADVEAGDVDAAVSAQADGAVGPYQGLPADQLLQAARLGQGDDGVGGLQDALQLAVDGRPGLVDGQAADAHRAVGQPQVDRAFRLHDVDAGDGLVGQGLAHLDL